MNLLYITRKYPPMIGGLEKLSYALAKEFSKNTQTTLITWGKSQKYLPYFIPLAFLKACFLIPMKKIDHIHIGDALLAPLGLFLKIIFNVNTSVTVAGLDITFNFPGYQLIVPKCVARLNTIICISEATLEECVKRGIPRDKCVVIPCGIYPEKKNVKADKNDLEKIVGENLKNKKILITVGRLVKRKGVYWFIEHVLPQLSKNIVYFVIGDGPEKERIHELIKKLQLQNRVHLLGKIPDDDLKVVYATSDFFIMPNIKVDNNIEGFGIVAIEASSTGLPVIASDMEGISNAVINNKTGKLVESMNSKQFITAIESANNFNKKTVSQITNDYYSWEKIGKQYMNVLKHNN
jgi:glycosyltransferase involved in cell wall biosynthesis